ncbi:HAD-IA family hydrolase [Ferrovibrio sp.]|uniref:HAD-IA family hydrolase n=1 Tax=Ferrovibrio sp. TaxID=1917215 RepID=UPI0025C685FA|nr:HAD-IA family hydrolase [Ferrovibrio sp.]MBX3454350.1 HAD-IA family hydrolase [Ferrovibrio sp.]
MSAARFTQSSAFEAPRLVLFDCDGTLVDSQHHIVAAMQAAFASHALAAPAPDAVRRLVGLSLEVSVRRLLESMALSAEADADAVVAAYRQAAFAMRHAPDHDEPLFPGLLEALAKLEADGYLLGIATGKARRGLDATLSLHGLHDRFVTLQTADIARGKPDPDMVLRAMRETGAEPGSTLVVGDTTFDILMARNAGARAIGVAWGYHDPAELLEAGALAVAESYGELPALIRMTTGG